MTARPAPQVDVVVQAAAWRKHRGLAGKVRKAVAAALACCPEAPPGTEISVALADDAQVQRLNAQWRGRDAPTNVLSFPAPARSGAMRFLGDIVLAYETVAREADAEAKAFDDHLAHLLVHGVLHLLGLNHEDDAEAETMEARERTVLASLGISDPYRRAAAS